MKKILFLIEACMTFLMLFPTAYANGPWKQLFQDEKLPTQFMVEHKKWAAPALGSTTLVIAHGAVTNGSATTLSSFAAQPDFPRNIVITPDNSTGIITGVAVVSGTNIFGKSISENFTISTGSGSAVTGSKAFASVTSVVFPSVSANNVKINVGAGAKLGLRHCLANAGDYLMSEFNGVFDSTRGTIANSASAVESNTFQSNTSLNGSGNVDLMYFQNYSCYPN